MAVYIFMAENDEYYGSQKTRDAYANLHAAYEKAGLTDSEINQLLQLNIPDNAYFNAKGIYNYHGGGSVVFDDENVLNWVLAQRKSTGKDDSNGKDEATSDSGTWQSGQRFSFGASGSTVRDWAAGLGL